MVSFGHAMFMGIGAYAVAIPFRDHNINPLYLLALAPAAGALVALITGVRHPQQGALLLPPDPRRRAAVLGGRARLAELHGRDERHHGRLHPGLAQLDHEPEQPLLVHLRLHAPVHDPHLHDHGVAVRRCAARDQGQPPAGRVHRHLGQALRADGLRHRGHLRRHRRRPVGPVGRGPHLRHGRLAQVGDRAHRMSDRWDTLLPRTLRRRHLLDLLPRPGRPVQRLARAALGHDPRGDRGLRGARGAGRDRRRHPHGARLPRRVLAAARRQAGRSGVAACGRGTGGHAPATRGAAVRAAAAVAPARTIFLRCSSSRT